MEATSELVYKVGSAPNLSEHDRVSSTSLIMDQDDKNTINDDEYEAFLLAVPFNVSKQKAASIGFSLVLD
ncbi:hypothetical protein ACU8KH_06597 [Lachancea thermotolerans]